MDKINNLKREDVLNVILKIAQSTIKKYCIPLTGCLILGAIANPSTGAIPLPELTVPNGFGVNIHFRGEPRDLDLIADAGFKFIRMDLTWGAVERKKGIYEFEKSGYDALTKGCSKQSTSPKQGARRSPISISIFFLQEFDNLGLCGQGLD